jgi:predicted phage terminase large subunit-like protein
MAELILPPNIDRDAQLLELDRLDCEESLYTFFRGAWHAIDPAPWVDGWCMEAISQHLEAVCYGQIKRLLINISPRCSKSNLVSVAFPPWVWIQPEIGPISGPQVPFLHASYANQLSLRDSVKRRRLIESPWYQARWANRFQLTTDQNTKSRFTNDKRGECLITSVDGTNTGEGGMCIIIDDPNSVDDVESEASIQGTIDWWTGTMPTRLNNQETGAYIIIQQRTFENDLTGHILESEAGDWVHLMIPMRYEPERSYHTVIGWKDPREEPGELMWPERFGEGSVKRLETRLGPYRTAGQLQQRPEPAGGGIIKREWWLPWDHEGYPPMDFVIATLDTAYTEDRLNDPSGMMVWGIFSHQTASHTTVVGRDDVRRIPDGARYSDRAPNVFLMYAWDSHLELHELVTKVAETCVKLKVDLLVIENKASGISVFQEIRRLYTRENFGVKLFDPKSQDKMARLYSVQHLFAEGIIYAPDKIWVDRVITQIGQFPKGKNDEYVDLTSMGLRELRDMGLLVRQPEQEAEIESRKVYPRGGMDEPLYPV